MKTISLHQPWATFVTLKWKTIETRTHQRFKSLVGKRIAIHAAQKIGNMPELEYFPQMGQVQARNLFACIKRWRGVLLCTAKVTKAIWAPNVDFVEREEWNRKAMCDVAGKYCLFLEDIKPLKYRIPFRGRQGTFNVPDELLNDE